jgi:hypothetical protein
VKWKKVGSIEKTWMIEVTVYDKLAVI